MTYRQPETLEQALVEALYLRLVAPNDGAVRAATLLAEQFASELDDKTVAVCAAAARERFGAESAISSE